MLFRGLDRFSEDIDLDGRNANKLKKFIKMFCKQNNYHYVTKKDTNTTYRVSITYNEGSILKVELSMRSYTLYQPEIIHNIAVAPISVIIDNKIIALNGRYKLRDLYDIVFLLQNYPFTPVQLESLRMTLYNHFPFRTLDDLIDSQADCLVPPSQKEVLYNHLLDIYNYLDLLED